MAWGQIEITMSQVFFRSTLTFALVNRKPVVPGRKVSPNHCIFFQWNFLIWYVDVLVSPVRCVERFSQLNPEEINDLFLSAQLIAKKIEEFYGAKSLSIAIQDGEYAGQTVKVWSFTSIISMEESKYLFSMFMFIFSHENLVILKRTIPFIMRLMTDLKIYKFIFFLSFSFSWLIMIRRKKVGETKKKWVMKRKVFENYFIQISNNYFDLIDQQYYVIIK